MGAPLEKQRFGARRHTRVAFAQASDHYSAEVLATLSAERSGAPVSIRAGAPARDERRAA